MRKMIPVLLFLALGPPGARAAAPPVEECGSCHEAVVKAFASAIHSRLAEWEAPGAGSGCASCHGDSKAHLESGDAASIGRFEPGDPKSSAACLSCHEARGLAQWKGAAHAGELACVDCHRIHAKRPATDACASCHAEIAAKATAPSRHPLREGKMSCASCHDLHSAAPGALRSAERGNDLCLGCHTAQQGPFVFQHDPVEEDCMTCHDPHGSTANNLLVANEPFLCMQCHELHFHAGFRAVAGSGPVTLGGRQYPNVQGEHGNQQAFGTKCTQCHTRIHGSDLPSNTVPGQGSNLTR